MSTVWPFQCLKNLHKAAPASDGLSEISRHENSPLLGQYTHADREQGRTNVPGMSYDHPTGTGVYNQHPEVIITTCLPNK